MNFRNLLIASIYVFSLSLVNSHATAEDNSNVPTSVGHEEASEHPTTSISTMPKLNIRWDCGDCAINEKVIPLIEQTYAAEAGKNNQSLSESDVAEVAIIDFRQRSPAKRAIFGFMAGKDRLGIKVSYKGREFEANDYSANAIYGMNSLCESVAKATYKKISVPGNE